MAKPKWRCVTIGKRTTSVRSRPATPSTIRSSITSSSGAPRTSSRRTPPSKTPTLSLILNTSSSAFAAHQAHQAASAPLRRHAGAVRAHEQHRSEQLGRGGAHPVFNGQYPQWRREAKALIAKGQQLLDTPDPAQAAETAWLSKVAKATTNLEQTVRDDKHLHQSRQALNAELEPHAEALCRRYLPDGVKRDGQWRVSTVRDGEEHALTVQLSGAGKGAWEDKTTDRRGDLLDLIGRTAADGDIIQAMDAARAFLEAQLRQQHKMAEDLEEEQTIHKSRGHGISL